MLASTCLCVLDRRGEILFVSQGWEAFFGQGKNSHISRLEPGLRLNELPGLRPSELPGLRPSELNDELGDLPAFDPAVMIRLGVEAVLRGRKSQISFEFSDSGENEKEERLVRIEIAPLQTQERGCQIVAKDISDRKTSDENGTFFSKLERLTSEASLRLTQSSSDKINENITLSLAEIAQFAGVELAFVSRFHAEQGDEPGYSSMTHFWYPKGPADFETWFQKVPFGENPHHKKLLENESVVFQNLEVLPDQFKRYRVQTENLKAKSMATVPIFLEGQCFAYVGFVSVGKFRHWTDSEIMILRVLSEILSKAFFRQKIENALREREKSLLAFYRESDNPAWCFAYDPPIPIHLPVEKQLEMIWESYFEDCNEAAAQLVGLKSREELLGVRTKKLFGEPRKAYVEMIQNYIRDGYRCINARVEVDDPDGSVRVWIHQAQGVVHDGKLYRTWANTRDVTDSEDEANAATKQGLYRNSGLTEEEIVKYVESIEKLMKDERPYLDPGFNLSKLSKLIRVPDYQISQILNMGMKTSFYDLINRYRIEHLVMLLSKPAHDSESILDLAFQVGFNSKSTFNIAFKKIIGKTPSIYRTQIQLSRPQTL